MSLVTSNSQRTTDRRYYGVVEAIVADVNDPAKEGRVRLQFPWFDDNFTSEWARVRQFYAGNGYGAFWIPEAKDEVLVSFVHGDMRQPIVLGGLYNGEDKPPSFRNDDKDEKVIRTRKGHEIRFDDLDGSEKIVIIDSKTKNRIVIDTEANSITIKSDGGKIILEADDIELNAVHDVVINAGNDIKATANSAQAFGIKFGGGKIILEAVDIDLTASSGIKADAKSIDATAKGKMNLTGKTTNIKGKPIKLN